jgi:glyoxylase-like metal-dependent hydrolase (beta-lactamase superfamily II)
MKLSDNLYWYYYEGFKNNCNTIVIKNERCILIDPGHSWNLESLLQKIRKDKINPKNIDFIFNSHSHPDHCESNGILSKPSNAKISMHELEAKYLQNDGGMLFKMFELEIPDFNIDFFLEDSFELDGLKLEIIYTPGHSPGSICVYWPEKKVLICGDLIFAYSFGRTDLPGGDASLIKKSIEEVSKMDIEYLLPGHGNIIKHKINVKNNFDYVLKMLEYNY